jgi:Domain of Unknown Function (DUF748)
MTLAEPPSSAPAQADSSAKKEKPRKRRGKWLRRISITFVALLILLVAARMALPTMLRWYVNRTIDQNPLYDGEIGDITVHLYRGAYTIHDIRLVKTTGNVPVPLFSSPRVDLAMDWDALLHRKLKGRIKFDKPELNFVDSGDAGDPSQDQTGAGGPWLEIIKDLFPFKINKAIVTDGTIHFRTYNKNPPVDVYMSHLDATVENLTNIKDETTPLVATVKASALAMDSGKFEYEMKLDPFSYRPTFQLAVRLLGLDVTKVNQLARAYGKFDFERGFFDLVVELDAKEGRVEGYVKPLFREIKILSLDPDLKEDNVIEFFWEALVGVATGILKNPPRNQFGTVIPLRGDLDNPQTSILAVVGNVLRNAFVRAYLPRIRGQTADQIGGLEFGRGSITEPSAVGND